MRNGNNNNSSRIAVPGYQIAQNGHKTITRSFRLSQNLDESVIFAASKRQITPSTLLNQILRAYFDWYQFASGDGSPFVMVNDQFLLGLMEKADDAAIVPMAKGPALASTLDFIKFRYQKIDINSVLEFIELMSANMNMGSFGIANVSNKKVEIRIRHSLGSKWSAYIGALLTGLFESIPGTRVESQLSTTGCSIAVATPTLTGY